MMFCQDCSFGIPDPANSDACGDCGGGTVVDPPVTGNPPVTDAPVVNPPLPPVEPCSGENCTQGIPTPPDNRCNNPQNLAPQPAPQTTLNPKAGATDFERLLHMSILFYEAQAGFRNYFVFTGNFSGRPSESENKINGSQVKSRRHRRGRSLLRDVFFESLRPQLTVNFH